MSIKTVRFVMISVLRGIGILPKHHLTDPVYSNDGEIVDTNDFDTGYFWTAAAARNAANKLGRYNAVVLKVVGTGWDREWKSWYSASEVV
jgi:hypothetical protein